MSEYKEQLEIIESIYEDHDSESAGSIVTGFKAGGEHMLNDVIDIVKKEFAQINAFIDTDKGYSEKYKDAWEIARPHIEICEEEIIEKLEKLK